MKNSDEKKLVFKKERRFKKEYVYITLLSILLIALIILFIKVATYNKQEDVSDIKLNAMDTVVDYKVPVNNSCDSYDSLKEKANKITVEYGNDQIKDKLKIEDEDGNIEEKDVSYDTFTAYIKNIESNLSVSVKNNITSEVNYYKSNEIVDNQIKVYPDVDYREVGSYTVVIYSVDDCTDAILRKFTFKTPVYNPNSELEACENNNNVECQEFILDENINVTDLVKNQDKITESDNKKSAPKYLVIIMVVLLVIAIILVVSMIIGKRRGKQDEKN